MNSVNVNVSAPTDQSHVVVNNSSNQPVPAAQATGLEMPSAFDNGSQNTENP